MKKILTIVTIFSFLAVTVTPLFSFNGGRGQMGPGPRAGDYGDPITIPSLNLTVEQKTKLYDLRINHLKQIKPLMDKMFIKQGDLRLLWSEKNPDRTKILAMQKEISSLDGRIQDRTTLYRLSVLKELTSEQREKIRINSGNNEFGPPQKGFGFAQHLNLSQNQLNALRESRSRYDAEITDLRNSLAMKWMEMRKLFKDPKTDEALLIAKQKDISALQQQLIDKRAQMMIEDRKILTPEQIAKFDQMPFVPGFMERDLMENDRANRAVMDY